MKLILIWFFCFCTSLIIRNYEHKYKLIATTNTKTNGRFSIYSSFAQVLVKKRADPLTPRRTSRRLSTYVPQTSLERSNISGGTCVLTSWTAFLAALTFFANGSLRLIATSISLETSLATGRLEGNSLKGIAFLHLLPESFLSMESAVFDDDGRKFVSFSSLRYSRFPAVNLKHESTPNFPATPALSWGQLWPINTVKLISEVNEKVVQDFDVLFTVRCASPIRTRAGGCRSVNPMCLPVEYKRRHFPGSKPCQFCKFQY